MFLYLDTSCLVKLYVEEADSQKMVDLVNSAEVAVTSMIAYAEARAAFARRFRENAFTPQEYGHLVSTFHVDWENYFIINVTLELVHLAGELAEKHALRGFDAIHLTSAMVFHQETCSPVFFVCSDLKLQNAAQAEGLAQPF